MIHTDEEDNLIIRTHIYDANKHLPIHEKVAMNVFVTGIEVDGEEVTFHHIVTEPILDDNCGVTRDVIDDDVYNLENIGQRDLIKMGLKGASAIGGGLSMFPPTAAVGIPLSIGATAAQAYREDPEYFKQKIKEYTGYSP